MSFGFLVPAAVACGGGLITCLCVATGATDSVAAGAALAVGGSFGVAEGVGAGATGGLVVVAATLVAALPALTFGDERPYAIPTATATPTTSATPSPPSTSGKRDRAGACAATTSDAVDSAMPAGDPGDDPRKLAMLGTDESDGPDASTCGNPGKAGVDSGGPSGSIACEPLSISARIASRAASVEPISDATNSAIFIADATGVHDSIAAAISRALA